MRVVSDFREAMWGVLQQGISTLDVDFVAYAGEHFDRLLANAATPRFEAALRDIAVGLTGQSPPEPGQWQLAVPAVGDLARGRDATASRSRRRASVNAMTPWPTASRSSLLATGSSKSRSSTPPVPTMNWRRPRSRSSSPSGSCGANRS